MLDEAAPYFKISFLPANGITGMPAADQSHVGKIDFAQSEVVVGNSEIK